jgi:alkanesulfonate monooxygenase SsuD/methylene tetrahydromethanopterin reductase-like flavin-dependent oxidoreductase (luciferase family)
VRVGVVILPSMPWRQARPVWQRAEALGAHTGWTYDHLTWRELRDGPWFATVPLLAAVAQATTTMRLGTLVTSPNFRHPVTLAKEVMTLDDLSDGRITLGIGAGGTGWDAGALGQQPWSLAERTSRFAEFVDHLDRLLVEPAVDRLEGAWYQAVDARAVPGCVQRPRVPFAVAGGGRRAIGLAARFAEIWVTLGDPADAAGRSPRECLDAVRRQVEVLDAECERLGRDPATLDRLYMQGATSEPWLESVESYRDLRGHYGELGFTDLALHWPRSEPPYVADADVFEAILASPV